MQLGATQANSQEGGTSFTRRIDFDFVFPVEGGPSLLVWVVCCQPFRTRSKRRHVLLRCPAHQFRSWSDLPIKRGRDCNPQPTPLKDKIRFWVQDWVQLIEGRMAFPVRKRRQIGHLAFLLLWLRTRRSGVRVPPGAPYLSIFQSLTCSSELSNWLNVVNCPCFGCPRSSIPLILA
jgi:hypothetical protein